MKAMWQAVWLMTIAIGNFMVTFITKSMTIAIGSFIIYSLLNQVYLRIGCGNISFRFVSEEIKKKPKYGYVTNV